MKAKVTIDRDIGKIPTVVDINIGGRKLKVNFDGNREITIEGRRADLPDFSEILRMIYPVQSILSVRGLNYYDRNPNNHDSYSGASNAPHAGTVRTATYICPTDRMAIVESMITGIFRLTAAAPVGWARDWLTYYNAETATGGSPLEAWLYNNTVGAADLRVNGTTLLLKPGDRIWGSTADTSTGGTCYHYVGYKLVEFDI